MENVRDNLDWLVIKRVFSTFDLKDGFSQIELHHSSKAYTAIRTVLGLLQFTRLPQGLKNSPVTFQRLLNSILGDHKGSDLLAFTDDFSAGTQTEKENLKFLAEVFDLLYTAGVQSKLSRCHFGVRYAEILGHIVDQRGPKPYEKHVKAIIAFEEPCSGDEPMLFWV